MKTILNLSVLLAFTGLSGDVNAQSFNWAKQFGGYVTDYGSSVTVDAGGNVYTSGIFCLTVDFDPGPDTFNLTAGYATDIFVSKLDASGNFLWAKQLGISGAEISSAIKIDAAGNIYITGYFSGTSDFDPGAGTFNLTVSTFGTYDIFVCKLDPSGNFLWAKQLGGDSQDYGYSIAIDLNGNVYTAGNFSGPADFDPGPGTYTLSPASGYGVFISKLDASGNFLWAKHLDGMKCPSLAIDGSGNVYTTGSFNNTGDFDPGTGIYNLVSAGLYDVFVSKLDAAGNFSWAMQFGSAGMDEGKSIAVDDIGNIYLTGSFELTVDFDPGAGNYDITSDCLLDAYVSRLDASGNFVWAKKLGGLGNSVSNSTAIDGSGNIFTIGTFDERTDFDPGPNYLYLTSAGQDDIFVTSLNSAGDLNWAKRLGDVYLETGTGIALDGSGNLYITGAFRYTVDFDPGNGVYNLTSVGNDDAFVSRLSSTTGIDENNSLNNINIFPNPFTSHSTITIKGYGEYKEIAMFDLHGKEVKRINALGEEIKINRDNLPAGIYFIRLKQEDEIIATGKVIIAD